MSTETPPPWSASEQRTLTQTKRRWRKLTPWRAPLLAPTKARRICFLEPPPWAADFRDALIAAPVAEQIVIIDDRLLGGGPDRWACIEWIPDWAVTAGILAGPAWRSDYSAAAEAVATLGHLVMIETVADRLAAWISAFAGRSRIVYRDGSGHTLTLSEAEGSGA